MVVTASRSKRSARPALTDKLYGIGPHWEIWMAATALGPMEALELADGVAFAPACPTSLLVREAIKCSKQTPALTRGPGGRGGSPDKILPCARLA